MHQARHDQGKATSRARSAGAVTLLVYVLLVFVASCGPSAAPALPTRTPMPTFTPVMAATPETLQQAEPLAAQGSDPRLYFPSVERTASPSRESAEGRSILVDQSTQLMHVYEDGVEVRTIPCSTGLPDEYRTAAWTGVVGTYWGTFFVDGRYADDAWFLFKDRGSILIHSSPYSYESGERVYHDLRALGRYPSSHGCVRIHPEDSRWLKRWKPAGVPITITAWSEE